MLRLRKISVIYINMVNSGGDYKRMKMLNKSAIDLERKEQKKKRKANVNPGFTSWADNTARQYNRLTKGI